MSIWSLNGTLYHRRDTQQGHVWCLVLSIVPPMKKGLSTSWAATGRMGMGIWAKWSEMFRDRLEWRDAYLSSKIWNLDDYAMAFYTKSISATQWHRSIDILLSSSCFDPMYDLGNNQFDDHWMISRLNDLSETMMIEEAMCRVNPSTISFQDVVMIHLTHPAIFAAQSWLRGGNQWWDFFALVVAAVGSAKFPASLKGKVKCGTPGHNWSLPQL